MFYGCSMMKTPLYPKIIYNNRQPLISVTYEYGEIEVILPLSYDGKKPGNISLLIFGQGDTHNPIISILQEAPEIFKAYLPQGVLEIKTKFPSALKIAPSGLSKLLITCLTTAGT